MKRTMIAFATLAAMATTAWASPAFKAGTYTAEAAGIHGPVVVEVTFSKDRIEKVNIVKQTETEGIGSKAAEILPSKIVDAQSPNIDALTGATITSTAIRNAVADCVKQAGVDPATLVPVAVKKAAQNEELTTDVVIVGGGGSGMSATIRTRMNGLDAILVEKMPFIGGAASISGGQVVAQGSKLQKAFGSTEDSPESMIKDFQANGHNLNDLSKLRIYANNVGPMIDWLHEEVGVKFIPTDLPFLAEYSHPRALEFEGGAKTMAQHLREVIAGNGAKVLYQTRVTELIVEDGAVVGVKAEDANGTAYTIRAKKTLLTTGGYGANKDMLSPELKAALYYGPVSSTGDGLRMAQALDAKTQLLQYGKRYPNGIEVAPGIAKSTIYANVGAFDQAGILVDVNGKRFVNELANRKVRADAIVAMGHPAVIYTTLENAKTAIIGQNMTQELYDRARKNNVIKEYPTLDAMVADLKIPLDELKKTNDTFNKYIKDQKDPDFNCMMFKNAKPNVEGPFLAVRLWPRVHHCMGGLEINDNAEVLSCRGKPIEGLYAAGEVTGGVHGMVRLGTVAVADCMIFGRVAARQVAAKK